MLMAGGVALGEAKGMPAPPDENPLMRRLSAGQIQWNTVLDADKETPGLFKQMLDRQLAGVEEIVFAVRGRSKDYHYYASQGNYYHQPDDWQYGVGGGQICRMKLRTGAMTILLNDKNGGVRDPAVSYDARKIVFSYRKGGTHRYHLYEINTDGSGLKQLTNGDFDDIEPCYLPDGGIAFCSTRSYRWVNCWHVQSTTLYRCDADGKNAYRISENIEPDNTPAVLPDGRILYTRWEYVDRHNTAFHDLWVVNPDGTGHMVYWGNQWRGILAGSATLDGRPIPGASGLVAISGGHGTPEHNGYLVRIDPSFGPDSLRGLSLINRGFAGRGTLIGYESTVGWRDPYPIGPDCYLVACLRALYVMNGRGEFEAFYRLPEPAGTDAEMQRRVWVHEPRSLVPRKREPVIPSRVDWTQGTGRMFLQDVSRGRQMAGRVKKGEIRSLLVLEVLPRPVGVNQTQPLTWCGSWSLARILGTVPVEPDGSACFDVPAMRAVFFVALDAKGQEVHRMKSFANVMPGEVQSCVGCHELRTETPSTSAVPLALQRPPSSIEPLAGIPEIVDFPRDIQPILDRHCVRCHSPDRFEGKVILSGDRGPTFSQSYMNLILHKQLTDDLVLRGCCMGDGPPNVNRAFPLEARLNGSHHDVRLSEREARVIWAWLRSGAVYAGTYAALGSGKVYPRNLLPGYERSGNYHADTYATMDLDVDWLKKNCAACHAPASIRESWRKPFQWRWFDMSYLGITAHESPLDYAINLSRPECSPMLRAPLAKEAGGLGLCPRSEQDRTPFFKSADDPDYQKLLAAIRRGHDELDRIKRFDMPGFKPGRAYTREMKRYGILPADYDPARDPIDAYQTDEKYWRSFWFAPAAQTKHQLSRVQPGR
jgi:cytochrome c553